METDFASVWSRVTGIGSAEDELSRLRRWLDDEWAGIRADEALLGRRLPPSVRRILSQIFTQEKMQFRRLQTLYYLRTGDVYIPSTPTGDSGLSALNALRERYASILTQAESYRQCREGARDLTGLCEELTAEKQMQASRLRQLVGSLL